MERIAEAHWEIVSHNRFAGKAGQAGVRMICSDADPSGHPGSRTCKLPDLKWLRSRSLVSQADFRNVKLLPGGEALHAAIKRFVGFIQLVLDIGILRVNQRFHRDFCGFDRIIPGEIA